MGCLHPITDENFSRLSRMFGHSFCGCLFSCRGHSCAPLIDINLGAGEWSVFGGIFYCDKIPPMCAECRVPKLVRLGVPEGVGEAPSGRAARRVFRSDFWRWFEGVFATEKRGEFERARSPLMHASPRAVARTKQLPVSDTQRMTEDVS